MLMCMRRAFFPLGGTLATYPVPTYTGVAINTDAVADPLFGHAVQCVRGDQPEILLDTVPYTAAGPFTINLWFQVATLPFAPCCALIYVLLRPECFPSGMDRDG